MLPSSDRRQSSRRKTGYCPVSLGAIKHTVACTIAWDVEHSSRRRFQRKLDRNLTATAENNLRIESLSTHSIRALLLAAATLLSACGGGGGDSGPPAANNSAPTANAGLAQSIAAGTIATLDGTASSDANGDTLSYEWSLISKPAGSAAALSSTTAAKPTFTADLAGSYVVSLVVNDGKVNSLAATVTISAAVANAAPVANAGTAQSVVVGAVVTLDGTASSDANGDSLSYAWSLTSKPAASAAALSSTTAAKPTFTADAPGTYVATLVVSDGKVGSVPAQAVTTATSIPFDTLQGSWDAIANAKSFTTDSTKLTVSVAGSVLTIRAEQFFDGTCLYTANLTASREGLNLGTYQCSDFTTGTWQLQAMQRVDQSDIYIRLSTGGSTTKRLYGLAPGGSGAAQALTAPISSLIGTYDGIATGGPFGTEPASSIQVAVTGTTLTLTVARFFSGTCEYSGTIQADGRSIAAPTYRCSDFTTGTWTLNDLRSIGGSDLYMSLSVGAILRRSYGIR